MANLASSLPFSIEQSSVGIFIFGGSFAPLTTAHEQIIESMVRNAICDELHRLSESGQQIDLSNEFNRLSGNNQADFEQLIAAYAPKYQGFAMPKILVIPDGQSNYPGKLPQISNSDKAAFITKIFEAYRENRGGVWKYVTLDKRHLEQKDKPSLMVNTLEAIKRKNLRAKITLFVSTETKANIHKWHRNDEIGKFCELMVFERGNGEEYKLEPCESGISKEDIVVDGLQINSDNLELIERPPFLPLNLESLSSTIVRQLILAGKIDEAVEQKMISKEVANYIKNHQLFGYSYV